MNADHRRPSRRIHRIHALPYLTSPGNTIPTLPTWAPHSLWNCRFPFIKLGSLTLQCLIWRPTLNSTFAEALINDAADPCCADELDLIVLFERWMGKIRSDAVALKKLNKNSPAISAKSGKIGQTVHAAVCPVANAAIVCRRSARLACFSRPGTLRRYAWCFRLLVSLDGGLASRFHRNRDASSKPIVSRLRDLAAESVGLAGNDRWFRSRQEREMQRCPDPAG